MLDHSPVTPIDPPAAGEKWLSSRAIRKRYGGMSDTSLTRWLRNGFPPPVYFTGRRYWRLSEVIHWEAEQAELTIAQDQ